MELPTETRQVRGIPSQLLNLTLNVQFHVRRCPDLAIATQVVVDRYAKGMVQPDVLSVTTVPLSAELQEGDVIVKVGRPCVRSRVTHCCAPPPPLPAPPCCPRSRWSTSRWTHTYAAGWPARTAQPWAATWSWAA
jgi:hypothetical protein